ncbi:DUF1552 domain-containing protein [Lignipirellula cremea]|uniref:DUF1552 domain-containing protein n=1 Tax=Lignipirellula cremea TaxID=2528010 RepID=A0A518DM52_9BACT|nr:DUF1552 domain-containing protein [Lignipirellula cremea]QDU92901.1 hypothetical protein Pla8534_06740 [Lignipirellula cremea]
MHRPVDRRLFLRASGVALALPFLESMRKAVAAPSGEKSPPQRMVAIGTPFGFDPTAFVPTTAGRDYALPSHLQPLAPLRNDMTIISGLSHPNTGNGGHKAEAVMLTGAPYPDYSHNLKNTISIDQQFAAHFRGETRYDSMVLSTYHGSLSCTSNGVSIPPIVRPSEIFAKLFLANTPAQAEAELERIDQGRSMLDLVGEQAQRLNRRISRDDRQRVDEYLASVRDVERQLQSAREWVHRPKPDPIGKPPQDITDNAQQAKKLTLLFDMIYLALLTDSTRAITIKTFGMHHDLSHHGKEPEKLAQCRAVETELLAAYGGLLTKLKAAPESQGNLLDHTMVMVTSNLRDGNTHWTHDLPALIAGGKFRHGQHLAFNKTYVDRLAEIKAAGGVEPASQKITPVMGVNQAPLCSLYVSMLQSAGVETDHFGSSAGALAGLEIKA